MKVLGVESSGDWGGVALVDGQDLVDEMCLDLRGSHTQRLLPALRDLLAKAEIDLSSLAGIAVSLGPGSFTGLRAGLGLGKGLAYGLGLKLLGVPTLQVMAAGVVEGEWVLAVADARRGEIFSALYHRGAEGLTECRSTALGMVEGLPQELEGLVSDGAAGVNIVADGTSPLDAVCEALSSSGIGVDSAARGLPRPEVVARMGTLRLTRGGGDDPATLEPLYVRPSDAETRKSNRETENRR